MIQSRVVVFVFFIAVVLSNGSVSGQPSSSKWSVGSDGMGNILQGDFGNHPLYLSGDVFAKYALSDAYALYGVFSFGALKTSLDPNEQLAHPTYPTKIVSDYSSLEIYGSWHFRNEGLIPEIFLGCELIHFDPESDGSAVPLPAMSSFAKNVVGFVAGAGFEVGLTRHFSFQTKVLFHFGATDYLDYYRAGGNDIFTTAGFGITYSFGSESHQNNDTSTTKRSWDGKLDSDGDGLSDDDEINKYHTDPFKADTDGDGLTDFQEVYMYRTDPNKPDTDGDGLFDGEEIMKYRTDPLNWDSDGDGLSDGYEVNISHTDPNNRDTDGDGIWDKQDKCPLVKGVPPDGCPEKK